MTRSTRTLLGSALALSTLLLAGWTTPGVRDREAPQYPYLTATEDGRFYFKLVPDPEARFDRDKGTGRAYRVGVEQDELLWETEGWYSFETHLAEDGRHLVRLGNWPRGSGPSTDHLAIAFLHEGKVVKSYSTADLVTDHAKVRPTVSHYRYRDHTVPTELERAPGNDHGPKLSIRLATVDGWTYRFDVTTGEIVDRARTSGEPR